MAKCSGCSGDRCSCKIVAGANTAVTGVGTNENPYVVSAAAGGGSALPTGSIVMYGAIAAPAGYLVANGQAVSRTTYAALFAIIGTMYGTGDGSTTFNLPDLAGTFPLGAVAGAPAGSTYVQDGVVRGNETTTLIEANLPPHTHTIAHTHTINHTHTAGADSQGLHTHSAAAGGSVAGWQHSHLASVTAGSGSSGAAMPAVGEGTFHTHVIDVGAAGSHSHNITVNAFNGSSGASSAANSGSAGSGTAFSNMPPYLAVTFLIKT